MDAFVHASGDGFGNTAPLRSDTGAIDMDAISQVAHVTQGAGKLTRKEKKRAKREMKRRKKEAKKAEKEAKKTYSSIKSQLKDRDKELSDKMADARKKRDSAKDVVNYIGYNKIPMAITWYVQPITDTPDFICDFLPFNLCHFISKGLRISFLYVPVSRWFRETINFLIIESEAFPDRVHKSFEKAFLLFHRILHRNRYNRIVILVFSLKQLDVCSLVCSFINEIDFCDF